MQNYLCRFGGKSVLFVMAVEAEYGAHLKTLFKPLFTGVGPVEAAVTLSATLAELNITGQLPELVVSLGSAGSAKLRQTHIYQVSSVSYRDMNASALGFDKGQTPFLDRPAIMPLPYKIPDIDSATLSTGANIVSGSSYDKIDADMVEMETFALLRACQRFGVDMIGLRGISDGDQAVQHITDWTRYLHIIDEKLAEAIKVLEQALLQNRLISQHV